MKLTAYDINQLRTELRRLDFEKTNTCAFNDLMRRVNYLETILNDLTNRVRGLENDIQDINNEADSLEERHTDLSRTVQTMGKILKRHRSNEQKRSTENNKVSSD